MRHLLFAGVPAVLAGCSIQGRSIQEQGGPPSGGSTTVQRVVADISPERVMGDVETLAGFGTRHTLSDTASDTRGIGAARRWLAEEFERAVADSGRTGDLAPVIRFDTHAVAADGQRVVRDVDVVNVVCELPGAMPEARTRLYYVLGHYDSRASDPNDAAIDAPGANDDASGVAVCLELARVLAGERLDATVVLMPTAGEEQGLIGARRHAAAASAAGLDVRAVLSNDIVGSPRGPNGREARDLVRVYSEGLSAQLGSDERSMLALRTVRSLAAEADGPSRQLARYVAEVGEAYDLPVRPWVMHRPDRFLRGGDHTGFNEAGFAAVRLVEVHEDYTRQHQDVRVEGGIAYGDVPEHVDARYLADVARLNAAAIVCLANAPSEPGDARVVTAELTNDTTIRWSPSPEPDVAGYEVVWRDTTSPTWDHALDVGPATEATLDLSKDHWFFGVRAYDREGYRSPVAFTRAGRE